MQGRIGTKYKIGLAAVLLLLAAVLLPMLIANADEPTYTVVVKITDGQEEFGEYLIEPAAASGSYATGTSITFTATATRMGYVPSYTVEKNGKITEEYINEDMLSKLENDISVDANIVIYLSFKPKVYNLNYKSTITKDGTPGWEPGTVRPKTYTYGDSLMLPVLPDTTEYKFLGWSITDMENPEFKIKDEFKLSPARDGKEITLWAIYKANQFKVTRLDRDFQTGKIIGSYEFMADFKEYVKADGTLLDKDKNGNLFFREYSGYTYQDKSDYYDGGTVSVAGVTITRYYIPNEYKITYDADGGSFSGSSVLAIFNQNIPNLNATELPTKPGYQFGGFWTRKDGYGVQYVDKDGKGALWDIAEDTTLYALWVPQSISIRFSSELTAHATITVKQGNNTYTYDGTPLSFAFDSEITITIETEAGYKLVKWNGNTVEHTAKAEYTYRIPAESQELTGLALPTCEAPVFRVDYKQETLIADGSSSFELIAGDSTIRFAGGEKVSLEQLFGMEIKVRRLGDGTATSHSEWVSLQLASRPAAPTPAEAGGKVKTPTVGESSMLFELDDADTVGYEFAFRRFDGDTLNWQEAGELTNLNAGTKYTFYIRVKATDTAPHGEEYSVSLTTLNENYLKAKMEELRGRIQKDDGQNVKDLIQSYIAKMEALPTGPDYQNKMDALIAECDERLPLARYKDQRIAEIEARCEELRNGGLYNDAGKETLESLRATAVADICDAASKSGVDIAAEEFDTEVAKIPVRIDLTWLFVTLGTVILLQVIALVILLRRHAKYADRVKYVRDGKTVYGLAPLPALALTAQFLPEKSALVALLLGVVALVLQIVLVVLIFRTAAIAKKGSPRKADSTDGGINGGAPSARTDSADPTESEPTADAFAYRPQVSVFHDDDSPSFEGDSSADGLQEEDWYDENFEDDSSADTFESDDEEQ
ncbi:MAG TPA: hypothetical protein DDW30_01995 [Clostridiales bacterium]|nr:hypothetical protein [Clostridiales bacterium]